MSSAVVCTNLSFAWPDGTPVLTGLNAAFSSGRTGLIGSNGAGKSTLLKLVAGTLIPQAGTITVSGDVGYLPQDLPLATQATVADLLGISATLRAGRRSSPRYQRTFCAGRRSCCSTSRPTTWIETRASGSTTRSRHGQA